MSDAVARLDTMKNYPQVMESLGVSTKAADASIATMSDRLQTLPTRLDSMAASVQGVYAATKDYGVSLQTATEASLAMNDLLLAGGQGTQVASAAMEQFRQIMAKGKPEMQEWKTLLQAAPGQMDQLAKSMLGPTANANDLYEALGGGQGNEAVISMNQLLDALIKLDKEGGAGLESLQSQAEKATGGIQTSMDNAANAITRGLADTMDAIGRDRIAGFFNTAKGMINDFFGVVKVVAPVALDFLTGVAKTALSAAPALLGVASAIAVVSKVGPMLSGITTLPLLFTKMGVGALGAADGIRSFITSINPMTAALAMATATVVYFGTQFVKARQEEEQAAKATSTFNDAVSRSTALDSYARGVEGIGVAAQASRMSMSEFYDDMQKHADAMQKNNEEAENTIASLNTLQQTVDEYAGKASEGVTMENMSAESKGKLAWAVKQLNDEYGMTISAEDILNGTYEDEEGNILAVKDAVDQLCESRKQEARTAALQANLNEAYAGQRKAIQQVQDATDTYNEHRQAAYDAWVNDNTGQIRGLADTAEAYADLVTEQDGSAKAARDADAALNGYNRSIEQMNAELGISSSAVGDLKDALVSMSDAAGNTLVSALKSANVDVTEFAAKLAEAGVSTEQLRDIGSANIAALARACDGNVDKMVAALTGLDGIELSSKHFQVDDDGTITFQKGELSMLDMIKLRDKGFIVTDNGTTIVAKRRVDDVSDAIDDIPSRKDSQVNVSVHGLDNLIELGSKLRDVTGNFFAHVQATVTGNAAATGAFVSGSNILSGAISARGLYEAMKSAGNIKPLLHGDGGIATGPTLTSVGFVGEAGAEAIVPLTNRQYVRPFARAIADEMGAGDAELVIRWLEENLGPIIASFTPTMSQNDFGRMARRAIA